MLLPIAVKMYDSRFILLLVSVKIQRKRFVIRYFDLYQLITTGL